MFRLQLRIVRDGLNIIIETTQRCLKMEISEAAAALAYYTLFSLFPLTLFLISISSPVLNNEQVNAQILLYTNDFLPPLPQKLLVEDLSNLLALRNQMSLVSIISLLWSASTVFTILAQNINQAWDAPARNFLRQRLLAFAMIGSLTILLIASLLFTTILSLLSKLEIPLGGEILKDAALQVLLLPTLTSWLFLFISFLLLYRWVPNTNVRWSDAAWGALVATIGWELLKGAFTWYLTSGLAKYELIYGSLGTMVVFMLWVYLSNLIMLIGANLSATIGMRNQP